MSCGARSTIIYNNYDDDLGEYVERYGPFKEQKFPPIKVVSKDYSDIRTCYALIMDSNTEYYIIYNGDNPAIIDFTEIENKYRSTGKEAVLFKLRYLEAASLANTILITNQKALLEVINTAIDENRQSPNIFEMIINMMLNRGIPTDSFDVHCWPPRNIPEFYAYNMDIIKNPAFFNIIFRDSGMKSMIKVNGIARVGVHGKINNSFISDGCEIDGTIFNSVIFPGAVIGEKSVVRDSIVLPFARIGAGTRIIKSIIDEKTIFNPEDSSFNIGNGCHVGSEHEQIKNNEFPRSIYNSITLIGRDSKIPDGVRVGGACYVAPGLGENYFIKSKHLYDGLSITR
jgi:ADP-glucose pyrophosphorylase